MNSEASSGKTLSARLKSIKLGHGTGQVIFVGVLLVVLCIFFSVTSPYFNQLNNYVNILRQVTVASLVAFGMSFVLLIGQIDLSVGSTVALVGVMAAEVSRVTGSVALAVIASLLTGLLVGFLNGFFVTRYEIPAFIATLAMMSVIRGGVMVYTNAATLYGLPPGLLVAAQGYIGPIPVPVVILIAAFAVVAVLLRETKFGMNIYAVGGNPEVARLSGIPVKRITIISFMICGLLTSMAGLVATARTAAATPNLGDGYELDAITAVVLGGTSMNGGSGSIIGTFIGVLLLGVLAAGLVMLNVNQFWITIIKGLILLIAVILATKTTKTGKGGKKG